MRLKNNKLCYESLTSTSYFNRRPNGWNITLPTDDTTTNLLRQRFMWFLHNFKWSNHIKWTRTKMLKTNTFNQMVQLTQIILCFLPKLFLISFSRFHSSLYDMRKEWRKTKERIRSKGAKNDHLSTTLQDWD